LRVGSDAGHVGTGRQARDDGTVALHRQHVDDVERAVAHTSTVQFGAQRSLGAQRHLSQPTIDVAQARLAGGQGCRRAEVRLLSKDHQKLGLIAFGGVLPHLGRDVGRGNHQHSPRDSLDRPDQPHKE